MPRVPVPLPMRFGEAKSKFVSSQTLVNCFMERDREGRGSLVSAPGLTLFVTCGTGPIRGERRCGSIVAVVSGSELYTVTSSGVATLRGTIAGHEPVSMAWNGTQLAIVADATSYIYTHGTTTLAAITDPDFLGAVVVDFIDQYFVFVKRDSQQFFISALADGTNYDATDVASSETKPDNAISAIVDNREVLIFGEDGLDAYYNSGNADFPFERSTTYAEYGIIGRLALTKGDNTVAWMAPDKTIRALRGGVPQIISDHETTAFIETWTDASVTRAFTLSFRGHTFFVFRNPDGCIVIDAETNLPHIRKSYGLATWRVVCSETAWGMTLVGDHENGNVYTLDQNAFTENGAHLVREWVTRTMNPSGNPFTLDELELDLAPGVGVLTGQGSDPVAWVQVSRDGGHEWGARIERDIGARGNREIRLVWEDFGQFPPHGCAVKFGLSDPVEMSAVGAWASYTDDRP